MTTLGMNIAEVPVSLFKNLTATKRFGSNAQGSAMWQVECTCGARLEANAFAIRQGWTHCVKCNPRYGEQIEQAILAVLPGTIDEIAKKARLTLAQVKYRLRTMKPMLCHTGRWRRPNGPGAYQPIICAGAGEDVPCPLKRKTGKETSKSYRRRVKKAVEKAMAGGKEDARYTRHIALRKADLLAAKTRATPQTWLSALMG